ncbi:ribosomal RNA small subunit methyltransferase A [Firmicutes bacterium CAG:791]|nr:ribosomal RNA small subunit methyltransferase A [Firmicutes bacterium CAG:791]
MSELLATPHGTMSVLNEFGLRAKKKYGQNFLINRGIVDQIVDAAEISKEDCVLEIGPGIGTMTQLLSEAAGHVTAVEIDRSLEKVLDHTLEDCGNVTILFQDILKTNLKAVAAEFNEGRPLKCVANLPYYITTPILLQLFQESDCFESITVMVQKEVADRILATEKDKEYGALSLAVRYYSEPELVCIVPPGNFIPKPGVDSAVLKLSIRHEPVVDADETFLFALIRAAFNQRRKTLANALSHGLAEKEGGVAREEVQEALVKMGLSETIRGEKLSLEQFAELARLLKK